MVKARFYESRTNDAVQCRLCPHECRIAAGERGECAVRRNIDGILYSENYGLVSSIHVDPVEKKPLYHFHPGSRILSLGSIGCNFRCNFCQNCEISQTTVDEYRFAQLRSPEYIVDLAAGTAESIGLAFTYNEPVVYYEFMVDTARICREKGLKTAMITNGYVLQEPLETLFPLIDAFNVDLKSFSEQFYKTVAGGHLRFVKENLLRIRKSGCHLEVTNLLIPSLNDDLRQFREMVRWIARELGRDTVLHISRYFPAFKSTVQKTSLNLLFNFYREASEHLAYVYLGNVTGSESQNTICSNCGKMAMSRFGYFVQCGGLDTLGNCRYCGHKIVVV